MNRVQRNQQRINFAQLAKVVGWLLMIEAVFMAFPSVVALCYGEEDWKALTISTLLTLFIGFFLTSQIRSKNPGMHKREGILLTVLVWIVFSFFGLLPFVLCEHKLTFTDAFFEAMAGFTTTGASTMDDIGVFGKGMHLWRALMQWIGGMGIIIFTLAVLPMLNHSGGMQMFNAEVTGITHDKIRPRISQTAKSLWEVYIVMTIICALLLWIGPMDLYDSICHAFGTVSTGGFSTQAQGVSSWNSSYVKIIVSFFMMLGGMNFALIYRASRGRYQGLLKNDTLKFYLCAILACSGLMALAIIINGQYNGWESVTIDPIFQVIASMTSTGYALPNIENWGFFPIALIIAMIFFCGCAGSTSGGAKLDRLIVLLKFQHNEIKKSLQPNTITSVKICGNVMPTELVSKALAFLCLYLGIIVIGGLLLAAMGVPLANAYFSSLSCMSNVGYSTSITSYAGSFADIPSLGKWVLSAIMLIGRLEVYSIIVIFTSSFWRR